MDKRGRGRPRYSRPGGRRYIPVITYSYGRGTRVRNLKQSQCSVILSERSESKDLRLLFVALYQGMTSVVP